MWMGLGIIAGLKLFESFERKLQNWIRPEKFEGYTRKIKAYTPVNTQIRAVVMNREVMIHKDANDSVCLISAVELWALIND